MKNSFSINIVFVLLTLIGLVLIPRLPVQLYPQQSGNYISISYQWHGMSPEVIEKEVTSPIEGTLASIRGVQRLTSESYEGSGIVWVDFKKNVDMDAARFEAASLMRSIYPRLPKGVTLPRVSYSGGNEDETPRLLVYTINGDGSSNELQQYVENYIVPHISYLPDISRVYAHGASQLAWELEYDKNELQRYGFSEHDINNAIYRQIEQQELGNTTIEKNGITHNINLSISGINSDSLMWDKIVIGNYNNRVVRLTDVAKITIEERLPRSYYRVNGLNSIYLVIHSAKNANQVELANKVKNVIENLKPNFPNNFSLIVNHDASEEINKEINKISARAFFALIILLLFVLIVSRNFRYLLIIALSLLANLAIAVIFYYFLNIEIHLYSLAGITVSLGMIIDNTIIMADHLRHSGNKNAFLAILAATLTTMGAMVVIFFLKEHQKANLIDFAIVLLVNLSISILVALLLVPALMDRINIKSENNKLSIKRKRRVIKFSYHYTRVLQWAGRHRGWVVFVMLWGLGFPLFFLPDKWEVKKDKEEKWYHQWYNKSLGNQTYVSEVKPWVNRILGGSWYWFTEYYSSYSGDWDSSRTQLFMNGSMPDGSTIHQMNEVFNEIENYLAQFDEIESFIINIYNIDNGRIEINFIPEEEHGSFPHVLKNRLIRKANEIGSAYFNIYGVGQGFSNTYHDNYRNNRVEFRGYNYELMLEQANIFKDTLENTQRVQDVIIQTGTSWRGRPNYGFVMGLDLERLAEVDGTLRNIYGGLVFHSPREIQSINIPQKNGSTLPLFLREKNMGTASVWDMNNNLLEGASSFFRLKNVGSLKRERTGDRIRKQNQEYRLNVEYDFIGPYELNRRVKERLIKEVNERLPIGFSVHDSSGWGGWRAEDKGQYWLLLLVVGIIFALCTILFESLLQPLAVIATLPISFIGLFVTFALFKIKFDQGGYAAMILLIGLTVNSTLYIINDLNHLRRRNRNVGGLKLFVKAYNQKIMPILLTTLSTILGLVPFLWGGASEGFWFTLAAGATGGLIFSMLAVVFWLPVILIKQTKFSKTIRK